MLIEGNFKISFNLKGRIAHEEVRFFYNPQQLTRSGSLRFDSVDIYTLRQKIAEKYKVSRGEVRIFQILRIGK